MKLSPSTIAANLSAAAAAEAETTATTTAAQSAANVTSSIAATVAPASSNHHHHHHHQSSLTMQPNHPAGGPNGPNQNQMNHGGPTTSTTTAASGLASNAATAPLSNAATGGPPTAKISPKDSQVVAAILKEMGITEYEPRVLPQLVEFAYRYVSRVLEDAQLFSSYGQKKVIDTDDASLAIQMQIDRSFVGPPSRDILLEIARNKNTQPLPPIKSHNGMRLPADRYSMVAPNFRLVSNNKNKPQMATGANSVRSVTSLLAGGVGASTSFINSKITLANSNATAKSAASTNANDVFGAKRKLDDA